MKKSFTVVITMVLVFTILINTFGLQEVQAIDSYSLKERLYAYLFLSAGGIMAQNAGAVSALGKSFLNYLKQKKVNILGTIGAGYVLTKSMFTHINDYIEKVKSGEINVKGEPVDPSTSSIDDRLAWCEMILAGVDKRPTSARLREMLERYLNSNSENPRQIVICTYRYLDQTTRQCYILLLPLSYDWSVIKDGTYDYLLVSNYDESNRAVYMDCSGMYYPLSYDSGPVKIQLYPYCNDRVVYSELEPDALVLDEDFLIDDTLLENDVIGQAIPAIQNEVSDLSGVVGKSFSELQDINETIASKAATQTSFLSVISNAIMSILGFCQRFFDFSRPLNFKPLQVAGNKFTTKFPFSIPFDLYNAMALFNVGTVTPVFDIQLNDKLLGHNLIKVDMTKYDKYFSVIRSIELILFIIGLALLTRQILGGAQ